MKTIHDVEKLVEDYMNRHNLKYRMFSRYENLIQADCFDLTKLEAKLSKNGQIVFKVDGKRKSIYK